MGLLDRLIEVGKDTLKKSADALSPTDDENVSPIEAMARAGGAALARGVADDLGKPRCQARTRGTMGHMLRCGKVATKRYDGERFCDECAPDGATPLTVESK